MTASVWNPNIVNVVVGGSDVRDSQTLVNGQTIVVLTAFTYTPGTTTLFVYYNGVLLQKTDDYTESSGSSITLTASAATGDRIDVTF